MVSRFRGADRYLSNFFPLLHPIPFDGIFFPTSEHAFVASKTLSFHKRWEISRMPATSGGAVKRMGRNLILRPEWDLVRDPIMWEIVTLKFAINVELGRRLDATDDQVLVEGNTWHDNYWGDCTCGRPKCQAPGLNKLGHILETVRLQRLA